VRTWFGPCPGNFRPPRHPADHLVGNIDLKCTSRHDVSVVIPTVGRASLARALQSVHEQQGCSARAVVVCDQPERAHAIGTLLAADDILIVTTGALGASTCRNLGVSRCAESRAVAFLDDDDWWEADKLERQLSTFDDTRTAWSYTQSVFHAAERTEILPRRARYEGETWASYVVARSTLRHGDGFVQSSSLLLDSRLAQQVTWRPIAKHQDWDLVARLGAVNDHPTFVQAPLTHVEKQDAQSISKSRNWRASLEWYSEHSQSLSPRSSGDFVWAQIIRGALAERDRKGVIRGLALTKNGWPHFMSMVVGFHGLIEGQNLKPGDERESGQR
jgi:hypothetical protein